MKPIFCPECGGENDTVEQKFPHKTIILSTCRNPDCKLGRKQATLGPSSLNDPATLDKWGVIAKFDTKTGKPL